MTNTMERYEGQHQFKGPHDHARQMKVLKQRAPQETIISLCLRGTMSRCSQIGSWDKQSICFFSEESVTSSRCMYWIEAINGHCDCMEAQRFSRGESVDLKKFRRDKIHRSLLGNKEIWDESEILNEIKTIFGRKKMKYGEVDIGILQTRYTENKLAAVNGIEYPLFDSEWEVFYTGGGDFVEDSTKEFIENKIRSSHDIDHMVNLLMKHEEIHAKFRTDFNKSTDEEMNDVMAAYEEHQDSIHQISESDWRTLDLGGMVEYKISTDRWFNYADGFYYVYNQPEKKYDRIPDSETYDKIDY